MREFLVLSNSWSQINVLEIQEEKTVAGQDAVSGEFVTLGKERYYAIHNVDEMPPFFISVVSSSDHWLFVSSTGGLTAGRVSPEKALFPYITVDKIHDSWPHTGCKTLLRVESGGGPAVWEPFDTARGHEYSVSRNLYKNVLGNKLRFEEINHTLGLAFRYCWVTSDRFGFVRICEIENLGGKAQNVAILDGLQNLLPAATPRHSQNEASNLVNAYKWSELDTETGLGMYALYSGISDRAEPVESLRANTVFALGLPGCKTLLSANQLDVFRRNGSVVQEPLVRGTRCAYLVNAEVEIGPQEIQSWHIVADIEKPQADVATLRHKLQDADAIAAEISDSIEHGSDELARIIGTADGFQYAAEENVTAHHYANVLFNVMRGGVFADQYRIHAGDLVKTIRQFNRQVHERHEELLAGLPESMPLSELLDAAWQQDDRQLARLFYEYLPITFGRRHGDPSRPWNHFAINLKDEHGQPLLSYQGNWRDIFQNWEALALSYPEFIENIIAKFVNASTIDGYNPYRITKEGIDWEIEDPEDPWSYIGYWGDHQIIYLLKLLEMSRSFHPERLARLLHEPIFSYANVPYRIKCFDELLANPKDTVVYDTEIAQRIEERVAAIGADGKLVLDSNGDVYQVNLLDKLLIPLLAKLGNLVVDGGIWLNTQRPEWNDANNALVGQGLSMVTLYYMRRYVRFMQDLLDDDKQSVELSIEVTIWLTETATVLQKICTALDSGRIDAEQRYDFLRMLGMAADRYRQTVYEQESFSGKAQLPVPKLQSLLDDALAVIDHTIATNKRDDGLYHAYNLLEAGDDRIDVDSLYLMLEGQVAAVSSGALDTAEIAAILESLFTSDIYREDQKSFMLYPDRRLPGFLEKNHIPQPDANAIPVLQRMLDAGDTRLVLRDADQVLRFNADIINARALEAKLDEIAADYGNELQKSRQSLLELHEKVFQHNEFTGRSGTMFGFEGLGSIYWHMVAKLMLATEEVFFQAGDGGEDEALRQSVGHLYYRIRDGIGFNKSPLEYGAFPTDPYSHTPAHAGARQPGMTGQVKEEVLCRFAELGVRVHGGLVRFDPGLLRRREFGAVSGSFEYLDIGGDWKEITVPEAALAFTWCQVPILYKLVDDEQPGVVIHRKDGSTQRSDGLQLSAADSATLVRRDGQIRQLTVSIAPDMLLAD
jgi:hypothetical protein